MLCNLKKILKKANQNKTAVGAFNTPNLESIQAVIAAAEKLNRPVILNHAQIHEKIATLEIIGPLMIKMAEKAKVKVCVHLDHGEDLNYLLRAMKIGFTSVMYDGSQLSYEENLRNTCEIVKVARCLGVSVEAELGRVLRPEGGGDFDVDEALLTPKDCYTKAAEAKAFVKATQVDALAIAFGTAHGVYHAKPVLDFKRIAEIHKAVKIPLVMHGGSGVGEKDFKKAIKAGISKVNYFTYMSLAGGAAIKNFLFENKNKKLRFDEISEIGRLSMQSDLERAIRIFSSKIGD